jgi:MarR family transcriptional regulator, temperature-dependent positive regulator of motility
MGLKGAEPGRAPALNHLPAIVEAVPAGLYELTMLEALHAEPSLSQRGLARQVGLPLSKVHFVLARLVRNGLIKITNERDSKHREGYLYVLTPHGLEAKAELTYRFLNRAARDYRTMRSRVEFAIAEAIAEASAADATPVCVLGDGALGEVVRDVLEDHDGLKVVMRPEEARVAVVVDPELAVPERTDLRLVRLA